MTAKRIALALGTLLTVTHASASLVNGDFEKGLSGWTSFTTTNGTIGYPTTNSFDVNGSGISSNAAVMFAGQVQDIPGGAAAGGGLQQIFDFSGGAYFMSVSLAMANFFGVSNPFAGDFSVWLDGIEIGSLDFGSIDARSIERGQITYSGITTAGSHVLSIQATRPAPASSAAGAPFQYIDDVKFTAQTSNTIPEPTTIALISLGLVGIAVVRRRKIRSL